MIRVSFITSDVQRPKKIKRREFRKLIKGVRSKRFGVILVSDKYNKEVE